MGRSRRRANRDASRGAVVLTMTAVSNQEAATESRSVRESEHTYGSNWILARPAGAYACAAAFAVVTVALGWTQRYLHDEAVFTHDLARAFLRAPTSIFFYAKAKPVLLLLYAIPSALGYSAFVVAHNLVGAATILLCIAAARRLGVRAPNVAGWLLCASLHFSIAASNGYPNSDGAFVLALALYLYAADRRTAAALVFGILPFARHELGAVTVVFGLWDFARRRDPRFLLAMISLPVAYALAGAVYQRDVLWMLHRFPLAGQLPEAIRMDRPLTAIASVRALRHMLVENAPILGVFGLAALVRRGPRFAPVQLSFAATYAFLAVGQVARFLHVDTSPRYYVAALPLLAILAAVGVSSRRESPDGADDDSWTWGIAVFIALVCATDGRDGVVLAIVVAVATAVRFGLPAARIAPAILVVASVGFVAPQFARDGGVELRQHRGYHRIVAEMRARGVAVAGTLFTDMVIARFDRHVPHGDVHLLMNDAMRLEIQQLLNPANGQRDAVLAALASIRFLYDVDGHAARRDAVYLLRDHPRMRLWRERLEGAGATVVQLRGYVACHFPAPERAGDRVPP